MICIQEVDEQELIFKIFCGHDYILRQPSCPVGRIDI